MESSAHGTGTGSGGAQPPPPSVAFFLINLGRRARESVDDRLGELGVSFHHLSALGHLHRQPGLSYSELARRAGVTVQSMQTTLSLLENRGLVDRGAQTSPGRRAELRVTSEGTALLRSGEAAVRAVDAELTDGLSPTQRRELERGLFTIFRGSQGSGDPSRRSGG